MQEAQQRSLTKEQKEGVPLVKMHKLLIYR